MIFWFDPFLRPAEKPLDICLEFARRFADEGMPVGRYELRDGIYCSVTEAVPTPGTGDDFFFEGHRRYADLHYIVSGEQTMWISPTEKMEFLDFTEEKDLVRLRGGPAAVLRMTSGTALVVLPEDAHTLAPEQPSRIPVKKIVFKIPVELLGAGGVKKGENHAPLS